MVRLKTLILFSVLSAFLVSCSNQKNEQDLIAKQALEITEYKKIIRNNLSSTIELLASKPDSTILKDLIHPYYGFAYVSTPGVFMDIQFYDTTDLSWLNFVDIDLSGEINYTRRFPKFKNCEEGYSSLGLYCDNEKTSTYILNAIERCASEGEFNFEDELYKKYDFECVTVHNILDGYTSYVYCFSYLDGQWFLTGLELETMCSA